MTDNYYFSEILSRVKKQRHLVHLVGVSSVLLLLCVLIGIYHVNRIYRTFESVTYGFIFDRAQVTSQNFSNDFDKKGDLVESEAIVLSALDTISKDQIVQVLKVLETSDEFDYARYISAKNVKYRADGGMNSTAIADYKEYISEDDVYSVFRNFQPERNMDEICFAAPVSKNGIMQGYLIGIARASSLFAGYSDSSSASVAERYLADENGDIVVYVKNDMMFDGVDKNIYSMLTADCIDDYAAEMERNEIKSQLTSSKLSRRQISVNGQVGYVLFKELTNSNGWTLYYLIYEENVRNLIIMIIIEASLSIVCIIMIMALMASLIMKYITAEQKRIYDLAFIDPLTGAPNENAFREKTKELLVNNSSTSYVMCSFDIVNFRYINEGYGHQKADLLLKALAEALRDSFAHNETFARVSADRFIGLCVDDGRIVERRVFIQERLKDANEEIGIKYPIKIKSGVYYIRSRRENISDMIDKADLARKSIDNSEQRILEAEYRDELMESTRKQERIESKMEAALEAGEFVPYLQPKWDMEANHICGAEALVRWKDKDGRVIPPGDFIPLFEKNGFIEKVDFYMLEQICAYIRRMLDENREVYPVSINQSRYLMFDPNYIARVQEIFLKYRIPRGLVDLELTETVFFQERDKMIDIMNRLKGLNMNLSMDDFGSGYSSLNLLRDIPFDVLKIDRGFLDESTQSDSGKWILQKIVEMAIGMNLTVICEGVENQEQVDMLLSVGCKYAQGYFYSRPIPLDEYIEKFDLPRSSVSDEEHALAVRCIKNYALDASLE